MTPEARRRRTVSLRTAAVLVTCLGALLPVALAGLVGLRIASQQQRFALQSRGQAMASLLENDEEVFEAPSPVPARLAGVEDVAYVLVVGADGVVKQHETGGRWSGLDPRVFRRPAADSTPRAVHLSDGEVLWDFAVAVRDTTGAPLGHVQFALSERSNSERFIGWSSIGLLAVLPALGILLLVALVLGRLLAPIRSALAAIKRMESGDLSQEVRDQSRVRELEELAGAVNGLLHNLRKVAEGSRAAAEEILRATSDVSSAAHKQGESAGGVAQAMGETGATVRQLAQASSQAAERAQAVIEMASRSEEFSRSGLQSVEESVQEMRAVRERVEAIAGNITELSDRMQQIGDIIATVTELAERSNLLALNAAIEAAKAGPQGRGFAVVAVEMRNLAEGSKGAAGQVRGIIADIQKAMRAVVDVTEEGSARAAAGAAVAERTGHDIRRLVEAIRESSLAARQIAAMAKQQNLGIESVAASVSEIHAALAGVLGGIQDLEATSQRLRTLNEEVLSTVARFRVSAVEEAPRPVEAKRAA